MEAEIALVQAPGCLLPQHQCAAVHATLARVLSTTGPVQRPDTQQPGAAPSASQSSSTNSSQQQQQQHQGLGGLRPTFHFPADAGTGAASSTASRVSTSDGGGSSGSMGRTPTPGAVAEPSSTAGPAATGTAAPSTSQGASRDEFGPPAWAPQPLVNFTRSTEFFARVAHIYGAYKLTQLRAAVMRAQGRSVQDIVEQLWDGQHTWAGQQMYDLCISLRGFYLKVCVGLEQRRGLVRERAGWTYVCR